MLILRKKKKTTSHLEHTSKKGKVDIKVKVDHFFLTAVMSFIHKTYLMIEHASKIATN